MPVPTVKKTISERPLAAPYITSPNPIRFASLSMNTGRLNSANARSNCWLSSSGRLLAKRTTPYLLRKVHLCQFRKSPNPGNGRSLSFSVRYFLWYRIMGVDSLLIVWFPTIRKECRHSGSQEYILCLFLQCLMR